MLPAQLLPVADLSPQILRGNLTCDVGGSVYAASAPGENAPVGAAAGGVETQLEYRVDGNTTLVRCYSGLA